MTSIVLIYLFARLLPDSAESRWASGILFVLYIAGLGIASYISSNRTRLLILIGIYIASVLYWWVFGQDTVVLMVLLGFLISYTALLLTESVSAWLAGSVIFVTFLLRVVYGGADVAELLQQELFTYVGLYALLRMIRVNRIKRLEQQRHTEELAAIHTELAETYARLQEAHRELEQATVQSLRYAVLEERGRIARDLHDSIGHRLTSVIVQLQALPYVLKNDSEESERIVRTVLEVARSCMQEVRSVVHAMGTDESGAGLISLRSLIQQTAKMPGAPTVTLNVIDEGSSTSPEWTPEIAATLYRCVQEALTNTIRHAEAESVEITIESRPSEVSLRYADDGKLQPGEPLREGFGLGGIRKRCRNVGGSCEIFAQAPQGIVIEIGLPLEAKGHGGDGRYDGYDAT